jgi:hypothetical protein
MPKTLDRIQPKTYFYQSVMYNKKRTVDRDSENSHIGAMKAALP